MLFFEATAGIIKFYWQINIKPSLTLGYIYYYISYYKHFYISILVLNISILTILKCSFFHFQKPNFLLYEHRFQREKKRPHLVASIYTAANNALLSPFGL